MFQLLQHLLSYVLSYFLKTSEHTNQWVWPEFVQKLNKLESDFHGKWSNQNWTPSLVLQLLLTNDGLGQRLHRLMFTCCKSALYWVLLNTPNSNCLRSLVYSLMASSLLLCTKQVLQVSCSTSGKCYITLRSPRVLSIIAPKYGFPSQKAVQYLLANANGIR